MNKSEKWKFDYDPIRSDEEAINSLMAQFTKAAVERLSNDIDILNLVRPRMVFDEKNRDYIISKVAQHAKTADRIALCKLSNNRENPNKNICVSTVAEYLGVNNETKYLQLNHDLIVACQTKYNVDIFNVKPQQYTVGAIRNKCKTHSKYANIKGYIINISGEPTGHMLLLDKNGKTLVDTAPNKYDNRKVTLCFVVSEK